VNLWGWAIYVIGALTVSTELIDNRRFAQVPKPMQTYAAGIVFLLALFWPVFAAVVVILRLTGKFRHG
jgi:hypothetical protein